MAALIDNKYEIVAKLGEGGQGTIYKARHVQLENFVALKLLPAHLAENPNLVARFRREAKVQARFKHPNIVRVTDIVSANGMFYLVMDFVEGQDLRRYIRAHGALPLEMALDVATQVGDALAYAHRHDVVHRDVKPSNVIIESTDPLRALLFDFGIAKEEGAEDQTQTGSLVGSYRYSAPEQLGFRLPGSRTPLPIDGRTDVFSMGLVLFEMCEGSSLFAGLVETDVIGRVVYDPEPLAPRFTRPGVPDAILELIRRAIERWPERRFQSMREMVDEVRRCRAALARRTSGASGAGALESRGDDPDVSNEQLESMIRGLELERRRRSVAAIRGELNVARQKAVDCEAPSLARDVFEQADTLYSSLDGLLEDSRLPEAGDTIERAKSLFAEAAARAAAEKQRLASPSSAARQDDDTPSARGDTSRQRRDGTNPTERLERARSAAVAARAAAAESEAATYAPTSFADGTTLESGADDLVARGDLRGAARMYSEARAAYLEASERAAAGRMERTARDERDRVHALFDEVQAALRADIDSERAGAVRQAVADGDELFAAAQWEPAADAFRDVARVLERIARDARRAEEERAQRELEERQRAEAVRSATESQRATNAARAGAEQTQAATHAGTTWQRAVDEQRAAEGHLAVERYAEAEAAFSRAARCFTEAGEEARVRIDEERREHERQETMRRQENEAAAARARATASRASAASASAEEHAAGSWKKAEAAQRSGEAHLAGREFPQATALLDEAARAFEAAGREASAAIEQLRRARDEEARNQLVAKAAQARSSALAARAAAERVDARKNAGEAWRAAVSRQSDADGSFAKEAFERATSLFDETAKGFEAAAAAARQAIELDELERKRKEEERREEQRRLEEAVAQARAEARSARAEAEAALAAKHAASEWKKASTAEKEAERRLAGKGLVTARQLFEDAAKAFAAATAAAKAATDREEDLLQRHRAALAKQSEAEAALRTAKAARAPDLVPDRFRRASRHLETAAKALRAASFDAASQEFERATTALLAVANDAIDEARRREDEMERTRSPGGPAAPDVGPDEDATVAGTADAVHADAPRTVAPVQAATSVLEAPTLPHLRGEEPTRPGDHLDGEVTRLAVEPEGDAAHVEPLSTADGASSSSTRNVALIAVAALVVLVATGAWLYSRRSDETAPLPSDSRIARLDQEELDRPRPSAAPTTMPSATAAELPQASPAPVVAWASLAPEQSSVTVAEGQPLAFAASLSGLPGESATSLRWTLDGKVVADGPQWTYAPDFSAGGSTRDVVVVAELGERTLEHRWRVEVSNVDREPTIESAAPPGETVELDAGQNQQFSVDAQDPDVDGADRLVYRWSRNGKEVSSGTASRWTLKQAAAEDSEVRVTVTDPGGTKSAERTWRVALRESDLPPKIVEQVPPAVRPVRVAEGASVDFRIRLDANRGSSGAPPQTWYVDGKEVKKAERFRYQAPVGVDQQPERHRVEVQVASRGGRAGDRVGWDVEVVWASPTIVAVQPAAAKRKVDRGEPLRLSVNAQPSAVAQIDRYEWSLDGRKLDASGSSLDFPQDLGAGQYVVEVAVVDSRAQRSSAKQWQIQVEDRSPAQVASVPPTVSSPPPPESDSSPGNIDQQARRWLREYEAALNRKDAGAIGRLRQLDAGTVRSLTAMLDEMAELTVTFTDVAVRTVDASTVTVSYTRIDEFTDKDTGRREQRSKATEQTLTLSDGALRPSSR